MKIFNKVVFYVSYYAAFLLFAVFTAALVIEILNLFYGWH